MTIDIPPADWAEARLHRWEKRLEIPLLVGALIFFAAYAMPILWPDLPPRIRTVLLVLSALTWVMFVVDYLVRVVLAPDRPRYLRRHWVDLLIVVLPLLRPLRLLRLVVLLSVLNRRVGMRLRGRLVVYVAGTSILLAVCASLAELDAERGQPGANIQTFGDATWWALTTMTTVGYGDHYPVTTLGRVIAGTLMIGGVALLGMVTATLASWLVEAVQSERQETIDLRREIDTLHAKIDSLLQSHRGTDGATPPDPEPASGPVEAQPRSESEH